MKKGLLSDISNIISGFAFKSKWYGKGTDKVIRIGDLQDGLISDDKIVRVDAKQNKISNNYRIEKNDLLMALSGATTGKIALAKDKDVGSYINQRVAIIRGKSMENKLFLRHLFNGKKLKQLLKTAYGAAQANLSPKDLGNLELDIPPPKKQLQISSIIDKSEILIQKRAYAIKKIDELSMSVFEDTFIKKETKKTKVKDLFIINDNKININLQDDDTVSFIPMDAVSEFSKTVNEKQFKKYHEVKKGYTKIKKDDLIIAKITPCYENGKMAIVDEISGDIAFGSTEFHTFRATNKELIIFLYYFLKSDEIRIAGSKSMKGAVGHRRVPADFFSNLLIPNPSSSQLDFFCKFVKDLNQVKDNFSKTNVLSKNLKFSITDKLLQ